MLVRLNYSGITYRQFPFLNPDLYSMKSAIVAT